MGTLGTLAVSIVGDTSQLNQSLQETNQSLANTGRRMSATGAGMTKFVTGPIVALGAAAVALTSKFAEMGDEIEKSALKMGVAGDALQEIRYGMEQVGVESGQTDRALERLNQRMGRAAEGNAKYAEALANLGISQQDLANGVYETEEAFMHVIQVLHEMEDSQRQSAIASELFGTNLSRDLMPAIKAGGEELENLRNEAQELGIVMDEEARENAAEYTDAMNKLKHSFTGAFMELAGNLIPVITDTLIPILQETLLPVLRFVMDIIAKLVELFGRLPAPLQLAVIGFVGLVAAAGPMIWIAGQLVTSIAALQPLMAKLAATKLGALVPAFLASTKAVWAFTAALLANPITWIVVAIAGLIAIIVLLVRNWEDVIEVVRFAWNAIGDAVAAIRDYYVELWDDVKDIFANVWEWFTELEERFREWGRTIITNIWEGIKSAWDRFKDRIAEIGKAIMDFFNPFAKSSPSLVELVERGTQEIQHKYQEIEPPQREAMAGAVGSVAGPTNNYFNLSDVSIRDDRDIHELARELHRLQKREDRGPG